MPATSARIDFITNEFRVVTAGPDATVVTNFGDKARDTSEPLATYFESEADATSMATARLNLLKANRRRFREDVVGEAAALALDFSQVTPAATVIDTERSANFTGAIVEIGIDYQREQSIFGVWG